MPKVRKKAEGIGTVQTEVGQRVDGLETENDCAACGCLRLEPRQHAISDPSERGGALPRELGPLALRRLVPALLGPLEPLLVFRTRLFLKPFVVACSISPAARSRSGRSCSSSPCS